jgi:hypothetical protein
VSATIAVPPLVFATAFVLRSGATGTLKDLETRARLAIKALNAFVVPLLSSDVVHSGLLAEWGERATCAREGRTGGRGGAGSTCGR